MPDLYVYRFRVRADHEREFLRAYAPDGTWDVLFHRAPGFLGTRLLRDCMNQLEFLTIDSWESDGWYTTFRDKWRADYERLDQACMAFTEEETYIGHFVDIGSQWSVASGRKSEADG